MREVRRQGGMPAVIGLGLLLWVGAGAVAQDRPTEYACLSTERTPGREVCACAQKVADAMLSTGDQDLAARIILDPDHFGTLKRRKDARAQAFIERYLGWGAEVEARCNL